MFGTQVKAVKTRKAFPSGVGRATVPAQMLLDFIGVSGLPFSRTT
ncbi:hypothetical protein BRCON_1560 [Candidatus Sumerlaea chitinivorans]|uniref:Uncharacterized protein n=1 Tax=Sumerlaea chitinivorans TaxID=2250252 RepID=A0A2Z4Y552_SUMC1|nr:hypothetical protein BRCON_1560 [Candidatus Sumerlaea chitinivorans]